MKWAGPVDSCTMEAGRLLARRAVNHEKQGQDGLLTGGSRAIINGCEVRRSCCV